MNYSTMKNSLMSIESALRALKFEVSASESEDTGVATDSLPPPPPLGRSGECSPLDDKRNFLCDYVIARMSRPDAYTRYGIVLEAEQVYAVIEKSL